MKSNAAETIPAVLINQAYLPCRETGCPSDVLFLPGFEGSRLYYRDVLHREHQVWEPDVFTDIPYLKMNADGTSKYPLYTKDIIGTIQEHNPLATKIANTFGKNLDVYKSFTTYLDTLVASSTFKFQHWQSYPYDWRYDVRDIVNNGTTTMMPDGTIKQVYLKDTIIAMASSSPTGRVTLVAHSDGGLLAKAAAISFGADAPKYIDHIIMVGTPQLGTPSDIAAMLHGDEQEAGMGMVIDAHGARAVADTLP
ncbi:hypothetical protein COU19_01425 [Candidatus Kaiserbacteria bacterium CG10_big_fil_rev_8_21_14_0_10_56_12]|uniref:Uncharacterized protein n=1 Tax=Candidatus Kaiserbacteria bacterium CG10_big_fil_rev_8_21_14_0_10_56_12 TaxID=1974611 RepID=A0A2H0U9Z1_9BACT|nr:MAG: hypothetical protein COU19_01425 [Candidatus Kaiserbacteria bacterium CG10_big_fil_rev_8_21_14_0_10_56_12]